MSNPGWLASVMQADAREMYGITETTVHVTLQRVRARPARRPVQRIGVPWMTRVHVLDGQGMRFHLVCRRSTVGPRPSARIPEPSGLTASGSRRMTRSIPSISGATIPETSRSAYIRESSRTCAGPMIRSRCAVSGRARAKSSRASRSTSSGERGGRSGGLRAGDCV